MAINAGGRLEVKRVSLHLKVTVDLAGAVKARGQKIAVGLVEDLQVFGTELQRLVTADPLLQQFVTVRHWADVEDKEGLRGRG